MNQELRRFVVIWGAIVIALILQLMPWPNELYVFRPNWLLLILAYWVLALPHRVNIGTGFIVGLILDIAMGSTLGTQALGLAIITYLLSLRFQMLRNLTIIKQSLVIVLMSVVMELIVFVISFITRHVMDFQPMMLWSCVINGILWPWIFLLLRKIRQRFDIS